MKYHKIRGVDKSICTAEQMVAYNIAFRLHITYQDDFDRVNACNPGGARSDCVKLTHDGLKQFQMAYDYKPGKFDEDAIFCALNAGLYNYLCKPFIASDYAKVGEAFPALYQTT